jgi:hypothetical protein
MGFNNDKKYAKPIKDRAKFVKKVAKPTSAMAYKQSHQG